MLLALATGAFSSAACSSDDEGSFQENNKDAGIDSPAFGGSSGTGSGGSPGTGGFGTGGTNGISGADSGGAAGGTGGSGGSGGGSGAGGASGSGASGGGPTGCERVQFRAHGQAAPGDLTPFSVGAGVRDLYQCFYFRSPWDVPVHGLAFRSLHDNTDVIRRWMLYATAGKQDGSMMPCSGLSADSELIAGWAPGADDWVMPEDVGMELPYGANGDFMLEVHYYNGASAAALDSSGVEVCATTALKTHSASISWLGTEAINIGPLSLSSASGLCDPPNDRGPITILRSWPHMRRLGRRMRTQITRADGGTDTLIDVPNFDSNYQYAYPTNPPVVVNAGDTLRTVCEYANDSASYVFYGPNADQEVCYNFVLAYPARALTSGVGLTRNSCFY